MSKFIYSDHDVGKRTKLSRINAAWLSNLRNVKALRSRLTQRLGSVTLDDKAHSSSDVELQVLSTQRKQNDIEVPRTCIAVFRTVNEGGYTVALSCEAAAPMAVVASRTSGSTRPSSESGV